MTAVPERVWGVSSGSYSAYGVRCICMTEAEADAVAAKLNAAESGNYNDSFVEEFGVVTADVEQVAVLKLTTTLWDDGTETHTSEQVRQEWPFEGYQPRMQWQWFRGANHKGKGGTLRVSGTDLELVRRTYSDLRAQLIAEDSFRRRTEAKNRVLR